MKIKWKSLKGYFKIETNNKSTPSSDKETKKKKEN